MAILNALVNIPYLGIYFARLIHNEIAIYLLVNCVFLALTILPMLLVRTIFRRQLNYFLCFPLGFLLLLGCTIPLNFFSYYLFPLSNSAYLGYLLLLQVVFLILIWRFFLKQQLLPAFLVLKNKFRPALLLLAVFLCLHGVLFLGINTHSEGDSSFHIGKINAIKNAGEITNREAWDSGASWMYRDGVIHQLYAGVSILTNSYSYQVWQFSAYFFSFLTLSFFIGLIYYVFKCRDLAIIIGIIFFINQLWIEANVINYTNRVVSGIVWPTLVIVLDQIFLSSRKLKVKYFLPLMLVVWGGANIHFSMFVQAVFIFVGFVIYYLLRQKFSLLIFTKMGVSLLLLCLPFLITVVSFALDRHDNLVAIAETTVTWEYLNAPYEQIPLGDGRFFYQDFSLSTIGMPLIVLGIVIFTSILTRNRMIKLFSAGYICYLLGIFTPLGVIFGRIYPYWGWFRFESFLSFVILGIGVVILDFVTGLMEKKKASRFTKQQIAWGFLVLLLILSSGKYFALYSVYSEQSHYLGRKSQLLHCEKISQMMKPNTIFIADYELSLWLPQYSSSTSYFPKDNVDEELLTLISQSASMSAVVDSQIDEREINYVVVSDLTEAQCQNFNSYWTVLVYDPDYRICLLQNEF